MFMYPTSVCTASCIGIDQKNVKAVLWLQSKSHGQFHYGGLLCDGHSFK